MTDYRKDRSDKFKKPVVERGNPHGGRGRRAQSKLAEQFETQTGRPLGGGAETSGRRAPADTRRTPTDLQRAQHARKGQAQSPRELNLNQPERKRKR
jgi:hypothetical protein